MGDDDNTDKKVEAVSKGAVASYSVLGFLIITFIWVWIIAGLIAFLASIICFGFNGSVSDKFLGVLIVLIIGPFYWFYFIYNSNYCTRSQVEY